MSSEASAKIREWRLNPIKFVQDVFHAEPDADTWAAWRKQLPRGVVENSETKQREIEETGRKVISRFFDLAMNSAEVERQ